MRGRAEAPPGPAPAATARVAPPRLGRAGRRRPARVAPPRPAGIPAPAGGAVPGAASAWAATAARPIGERADPLTTEKSRPHLEAGFFVRALYSLWSNPTATARRAS